MIPIVYCSLKCLKVLLTSQFKLKQLLQSYCIHYEQKQYIRFIVCHMNSWRNPLKILLLFLCVPEMSQEWYKGIIYRKYNPWTNQSVLSGVQVCVWDCMLLKVKYNMYCIYQHNIKFLCTFFTLDVCRLALMLLKAMPFQNHCWLWSMHKKQIACDIWNACQIIWILTQS